MNSAIKEYVSSQKHSLVFFWFFILNVSPLLYLQNDYNFFLHISLFQ